MATAAPRRRPHSSRRRRLPTHTLLPPCPLQFSLVGAHNIYERHPKLEAESREPNFGEGPRAVAKRTPGPPIGQVETAKSLLMSRNCSYLHDPTHSCIYRCICASSCPPSRCPTNIFFFGNSASPYDGSSGERKHGNATVHNGVQRTILSLKKKGSNRSVRWTHRSVLATIL